MEFLYFIILLGVMVAIGTLSFTIILKSNKIKQQQANIEKLQKFLEEMDEQAKLIVRTDIELNKAQEELDKKMTSLYALQRLSRAISTTLEENQIFKKINPANLEDLGFEKACGFLWNARENNFVLQLGLGCTEDEKEKIKLVIDSEKRFFLSLIGNEKTISSISIAEEKGLKEKIENAFRSSAFIISPILPQEGSKGFLFVGTENTDVSITEGDKELITILGNEIGQAMENARLFEKTWKAQQELEKKVEERTHELTMALEEVKRVSKRKSDFISSVSHELRTPLTSIKGYAAILLEEKLGQLPAAVKERLERVNKHSNELVSMVNDLLDIARIESGKTEMRIVEYNLKDTISNVSDLIAIQCKNKDIELIQDLPKEIPNVLIDRSQIERVFINLLGNAVKFTPQGGKITIKVHPVNTMLEVDIKDTGIGIPSDACESIFDEFYRVDNAINQQVKGTGLGLTLVRNIIEAHKGKVWVASEPEKGSTFSFTLPVK